MRSPIFAAAFAAVAIAVPFQKRDVVTDVDVVTQTNVVTVTAGAEPSSTPASANQHYGHPWQQWSSHWTPSSSSAESTSVAPTSTYIAPTTSSTSTSTYAAPTSSSASPSTYEASSTSWSSSSTSSAAPSSSAASSTSSSSTSAPTSYSDKVLLSHNVHRSNHSASDLAWDDGLASSAKTIAESCTYAHNTDVDGGGYGQNIAAGVEADNITAVITDLFYNGEVGWFDNLYGLNDPSMSNFESWGHFSQIVWKATTHVGCYTQDCSSQGLANVGSDVSPYFTVCNYKSPGNFANEYAQNIGVPLGNPTVEWNYGL